MHRRPRARASILSGTDGGILGAIARSIGAHLQGHDIAIEIADGNEQARSTGHAPPTPAVTLRHVETRDVSAEVDAQLPYKVLGKGCTPLKGERTIAPAEHLRIRQPPLT
jgi:hypothetical protein